MIAETLMGLDLSPTAATAAVASSTWDGAWNRVYTFTCGHSLSKDATDEERARRCASIAEQLVRFANSHGVTRAWIEGYAFIRKGKSNSVHTIAEVGGVVRLELVRHGIQIATANMSSARKLLLGKLPKKGAKVAAHQALVAAGSPAWWTLDESDAFVCLNWGMSEIAGAYCLAMPEAA